MTDFSDVQPLKAFSPIAGSLAEPSAKGACPKSTPPREMQSWKAPALRRVNLLFAGMTTSFKPARPLNASPGMNPQNFEMVTFVTPGLPEITPLAGAGTFSFSKENSPVRLLSANA